MPPHIRRSPSPQNCPVPCGSKFCCASSQYCAVSGSQCGDGTGPNTVNGNFLVWTSTFVTTRVDTNVQTIVSVYSSLINPSVSSGYVTATWSAPTVTGSNPSSGGATYQTLTASVSGSSTFLVPLPTTSNSTVGPTIGTNDPPQGNLGVIIGPSLAGGVVVACLVGYIYRRHRVKGLGAPKAPEQSIDAMSELGGILDMPVTEEGDTVEGQGKIAELDGRRVGWRRTTAELEGR
jgi:hypothetical protein